MDPRACCTKRAIRLPKKTQVPKFRDPYSPRGRRRRVTWQKKLTTAGKRYSKVSTRGEGRKNAEKWRDCHTFALNMEGQRLMCVFKELFVLSHLNGKNPNLPKLSMFLEILHNFLFKCHYSMLINSHNRLMCVFKEFFIVFWTHKISPVTRVVCT